MIRILKNIIGFCIRLFYRITYKLIPCDEKMVMFISFHGKGYSDNPKAIYEYMQTQDEYKDFKYIWAIKNAKQKNIVIPNAKIVEYFSIPYFFYLAKCKYWFFNCKMPEYVLKKKEQVYLQTWHGTPLKRLGKDIDVPEGTTFYRSKVSAEEMFKSYDIDVAKYNYMVSQNPFSTKVFQSAFGIDYPRQIETGYPRNDILSNATEEDIIKIKNDLHIPLDKKVILYAPTWRDNSFNNKGYTFELKVDFNKWKEVLGEEYVIIFKPHYNIVTKFNMDEFKGFVFEVSAEKDISSLYLVSDILVTDYSSVFFDYAILNRPMYFYMFDLNEYADELRGFYFNIYDTMPGDIVEKEEDLLIKLKENNYDYDRLKKFNEKFNPWSDGQSSKKVLDIIFHKKG